MNDRYHMSHLYSWLRKYYLDATERGHAHVEEDTIQNGHGDELQTGQRKGREHTLANLDQHFVTREEEEKSNNNNKKPLTQHRAEHLKAT